MPLGSSPKPSWGKVGRSAIWAIDDIHRIPSEGRRFTAYVPAGIMYADKEHWLGDLGLICFDSNNKLWKSISYYKQRRATCRG